MRQVLKLESNLYLSCYEPKEPYNIEGNQTCNRVITSAEEKSVMSAFSVGAGTYSTFKADCSICCIHYFRKLRVAGPFILLCLLNQIRKYLVSKYHNLFSACFLFSDHLQTAWKMVRDLAFLSAVGSSPLHVHDIQAEPAKTGWLTGKRRRPCSCMMRIMQRSPCQQWFVFCTNKIIMNDKSARILQ